MATPIPIDPQQLFLQNQQARTIDRPHRQKATEELYAFWTRLRSELSEWDQRLKGLEELSSTTHLYLRRQSSLLELQHELERIRKHCLASTLYYDDWPVPESLPVADLRLLHAECTKYSQKLEAYKERFLPKGKFVFKRYREALAERNAQGGGPLLSEAASSSSSSAKMVTDDSDATQSKSITDRSSRSNQQDYVGGILENITNASISVSSDGSVHAVAEQSSNGDAPLWSALTDDDAVLPISSSSLLIRKLHHCKVDIDKSVQALHIVESSHVTICVREPIQSAVHLTSCQHVQLTAVAQQLRLHLSTDLTCRVQLHAGAILEDCTRVVFFVEKETGVDVKDFNWLRTGIPSPNFSIQIQKVKEKKSAPIIAAIEMSGDIPVQQVTLQAEQLQLSSSVAASLETDKIEAVVMDSNDVQPVADVDDDDDDDEL